MRPLIKEKPRAWIRWLFLVVSTVTLTSCVTLPVTHDTLLMLEVKAPMSASDLSIGRNLIDSFAHQHGYSISTGLDAVTTAGTPVVQAFKYSGKMRTIRAYDLHAIADSNLPYSVNLSQEDDDSLLFDLSLRKRSPDSATKSFVKQVVSTYGKKRVLVAQPVWVEWISMGD